MCRVYTSHQKVALEIDFSGVLFGYTEITIVPASSELRTIYLHSRQCTIHKVLIGGHVADFVHHDSLANISMSSSSNSDPQDCHRHAELKRKVYSAMAESDEGELAITIPKAVSLKQSGHITAGLVSETATPEPQTPGPSHVAQTVPEFLPITVHIAYSLRNPVDGFEFVLPTDSHPFRVPHAYTTPSSPDSARCWVPCIDNLWERCTWDFEFVVPRYLEERAPVQDDEEANDLTPTIVICSGELTEQVAHPYNSNKTIYLFTQTSLTSVQHIAFAVGPFHVHNIPPDNTSDDTSSGISQPHMFAFCLPGHESWMSTSITNLRSAMTFYSADFGSYPFGSYKVVFVEELPTQRFDSSTLTLVTTDLLHGEDAIDQALETRQALAHALACQWVGINIQPKNWSDIWLTNGLALYITGLYMRKLFGNNDYRFRLKKDMERVLEWDVGGMPPICQPQVLDPPDAATLPFINLKAPLVLHILDRRLGKSGTSLGLSRVLPKIFLSAMSGEMSNNAISTHAFLRTCRKVSGVDPRSFAEQWIYGSGCPCFGFSASFNRKKMAVEITMRQETPASKALEGNEVSKALLKPVPFFEGQMTIRIHEADGTPYEHVLDIRSQFKRYEVPFNTKYKRVRRNTKRYLARQAAAQAAAEGDTEAAEAIGMIDMGFGLEVWEKESERENWKVADWTEEDENVMSGATYEWIRMDADFEWIAKIRFEQPDFMWVSQLQRDRDVVAQLEAVHALAEKPTAIVSSTLTKTVLVSNYYYRIRCEAALALVSCAIRQLEFLGLFHLFKLFLRYCYDPEDSHQDLFNHSYVPKPNDFSDFAEYFVRKSLVIAISRIRFENGKTPSIVRQFLIDQLRYNDNTTNSYSDAYYICTIISAAACATLSTAPPERGELLPTEARVEQTPEDADLLQQILKEVERYRKMDRLIPSPHNIVTIAALEFHLLMTLANLIPSKLKDFFPLTREGNYTQVRIAAFDLLFLTKWYTPQIMSYILSVMANDASRLVRRHVARNACYSLALLVQMGELKSGLKGNESLLIEEDGSIPEKAQEAKKSEMEMMIKVLRKDREVGKNEVLRKFLMPIALMPTIDHEVRWCILKLADILIKPDDESPPPLKLHLPSTPMSETGPQVPIIKPPNKPPRSTRPSMPTTPKTPSLPINIPTKLRVPGTPVAESVSRPFPPTSTPAQEKMDPPPLPPPRSQTPLASSLKAKPKPKPPTKVVEKPVHVPNKPVHVPKAQSGGMSLNDLRASRNALKKLKGNKHALVFLQPVDPIRDHAPNYFDIIKDPMDLSTMGAKLEEGMYKDRFAFQADFRLMIENAKRYNQHGSYVHNEAITLEVFFEKQWAIINKTLEAAGQSHANTALAPPPTPAPKLSVPPPKASTSTISLQTHKSTSDQREPPPPPPHPKPRATAPSASASEPSSSGPKLKLKVGSSSKSTAETPVPSSSSTNLPPKPRKPKPKAEPVVPDPPPPPYVDDGSHDILQEVLAIEREKEDERRAARAAAAQKVNGASSGKRKKSDSLDEDDILALATPAKREKHTSIPSSTSHAPPPTPKPKLSIPPPQPKPSHTPAQVSSSSTPLPKPKEKKERNEKPVENPKTQPSQKPSIKGKEKEVPSVPLPVPAPTPAQAVPKAKKVPQELFNMPINDKKCRDLLKMLLKIPEAAIFSRPVDPVLDGCPTYLDEIEHPMDLGTMMEKLGRAEYDTMGSFAHDMHLIFSNCHKFNPPGTYPVLCADIIQRAYEKEWSKALEKKLTWTEKRGLQGVMNNLVKEPISWVFREPVDPILLGIPTYFEVIPRKDARDLRTIRNRLDNDRYETIEALEADLELMISNAIKFNGIESEVGQMAVAMRSKILEHMTAWKTGANKKRKDGEKGTPQPTKKVKTG
ncbi:hypothetical protein AX16_000416 [Volvariella volvacea WC 439]|nr:hypothetical protein AX16_000416 [Volvariella volvacea WC 439]